MTLRIQVRAVITQKVSTTMRMRKVEWKSRNTKTRAGNTRTRTRNTRTRTKNTRTRTRGEYKTKLWRRAVASIARGERAATDEQNA